MVSRLTFLIVIIGIAYTGLLFHIYTLQLTNGEYYIARAESQYLTSEVLRAERGIAYFTDKDGTLVPAATNKKFPFAYAVPKVIDDPLEVAHQIALLVGQEPEVLRAKFAKKDDTYELIEKKLSGETAKSVRDIHAKGIYVDESVERFYPFGTLASHLLGFVAPVEEQDGAEKGQYGIEKFYNEILQGKSGGKEGSKIISPEAGENLVLTIDPAIQREAERILERVVKNYKANGGNVIVEDPKTGKILALAGTPRFDPNQYSQSDISTFLNPVTQKIYEPGSVFKVLTMAAGIDAGKITPETTFFDTGSLMVSGKKIQNWDLKAHGKVTMTNVIEQSLNTGAAFAERAMGDATFRQYLLNFGLSEKTGIDLPGEVKGDLRRLTPKAPAVAFATASFGQGVAVTPIGLMTAIASLANKGVMMRPYLNADLAPKEIRSVVRRETAQAVTEMMISAVDKAEIARIPGYSIAGKTGTAQVPDFEKGGYTDKVVNTYVGFGPTKDPRFVILFQINEPEGAPLAGLTVVPAFRDIAQFILNYYSIPPDRIPS